MKNISKRKDGRYSYRKQIAGKIITIYAKTKEQLKEKVKQYNLIKTFKKKPKNYLSLSKWMDEWYIKYKKNFVSHSTHYNIKSAISHINKDKFSQKDITQLTTDDIQIYLNKLSKTRTKEVICLYLNACLEKATQLNLIQKNPFRNVIKDRKIKNIRTAYTFDEQKAIFENLKETDIFAPICVYLFCGIRRQELKKDIANWIQEDNTLKVQNEKKRDGNITYRYIDITEQLKQVILNNLNQFITPKRIYIKFKEYLESLGIKGNIHKLRHTFTTNHLYLGTPDKFIQSWLGHEDISVTKNNYMNIDRSLSKEKLMKLYGNYYYIINP